MNGIPPSPPKKDPNRTRCVRFGSFFAWSNNKAKCCLWPREGSCTLFVVSREHLWKARLWKRWNTKRKYKTCMSFRLGSEPQLMIAHDLLLPLLRKGHIYDMIMVSQPKEKPLSTESQPLSLTHIIPISSTKKKPRRRSANISAIFKPSLGGFKIAI
jgi:hypothetical protein